VTSSLVTPPPNRYGSARWRRSWTGGTHTSPCLITSCDMRSGHWNIGALADEFTDAGGRPAPPDRSNLSTCRCTNATRVRRVARIPREKSCPRAFQTGPISRFCYGMKTFPLDPVDQGADDRPLVGRLIRSWMLNSEESYSHRTKRRLASTSSLAKAWQGSSDPRDSSWVSRSTSGVGRCHRGPQRPRGGHVDGHADGI
jgi:hypothetical protein